MRVEQGKLEIFASKVGIFFKTSLLLYDSDTFLNSIISVRYFR